MLAATASTPFRTQGINRDGTFYIQQAQVVAMGNWRAGLKSLPFFVNYSLLISLFHLAIPD